MIENHVVNLELSKRLYELGFKKDSIFSWNYEKDQNKWQIWWNEFQQDYPKQIPAYFSTELLEILPVFIKVWEENNYLRILKSSIEDYQVEYSRAGYDFSCIEHDESLPNALAKMLIHLIEKKLMEVKND